MRTIALLATMLLLAPAEAQVATIDSGQLRGTTEGIISQHPKRIQARKIDPNLYAWRQQASKGQKTHT